MDARQPSVKGLQRMCGVYPHPLVCHMQDRQSVQLPIIPKKRPRPNTHQSESLDYPTSSPRTPSKTPMILGTAFNPRLQLPRETPRITASSSFVVPLAAQDKEEEGSRSFAATTESFCLTVASSCSTMVGRLGDFPPWDSGARSIAEKF